MNIQNSSGKNLALSPYMQQQSAEFKLRYQKAQQEGGILASSGTPHVLSPTNGAAPQQYNKVSLAKGMQNQRSNSNANSHYSSNKGPILTKSI